LPLVFSEINYQD